MNPEHGQTLVLADTEHYTAELIEHVQTQTPFDLLVPMPNSKPLQMQMRNLGEDNFTPRWAGLATARVPYQLDAHRNGPHVVQYVQRSGERPEEYEFKGFLSTRDGQEVDDITLAYPKRWHVEEFFNAHQSLGWQRAGTVNCNIRYGQMSMALIAQAVIHQFRQRVGSPWNEWDAMHMAKDVFKGIDGDVRVWDDTIVVTLYNARELEQLRENYEGLPDKLAAEHVNPHVPWLYGYKLDFRFK